MAKLTCLVTGTGFFRRFGPTMLVLLSVGVLLATSCSGEAPPTGIATSTPVPANTATAVPMDTVRTGTATPLPVGYRGTQAREIMRRRGIASIAELVTMVSDTDPAKRRDAITALADVSVVEATPGIPAIIRALDDPDEDVRSTAVWALGRIGPPARDALPVLWERARNDEDLRAASTIGKLSVGSPSDVQAIKDALANEGCPLRAIGTSAAASLEPAEGTPLLISALQLPECTLNQLTIHFVAAMGLYEYGPHAQDAVPALANCLLTDPDWNDRATCGTALGPIRSNPDVSVPALTKALTDTAGKDEVDSVRSSAINALARFGKSASPAVPALLAVLSEDKRERIHSDIATTLGEIGPDAMEAVPFLIAELGERSLTTSEVVRALYQITGEDFGADKAKWQTWWAGRNAGGSGVVASTPAPAKSISAQGSNPPRTDAAGLLSGAREHFLALSTVRALAETSTAGVIDGKPRWQGSVNQAYIAKPNVHARIYEMTYPLQPLTPYELEVLTQRDHYYVLLDGEWFPNSRLPSEALGSNQSVIGLEAIDTVLQDAVKPAITGQQDVQGVSSKLVTFALSPDLARDLGRSALYAVRDRRGIGVTDPPPPPADVDRAQGEAAIGPDGQLRRLAITLRAHHSDKPSDTVDMTTIFTLWDHNSSAITVRPVTGHTMFVANVQAASLGPTPAPQDAAAEEVLAHARLPKSAITTARLSRVQSLKGQQDGKPVNTVRTVNVELGTNSFRAVETYQGLPPTLLLPERSELVYKDGSSYLRMGSQWMKIPGDARDATIRGITTVPDLAAGLKELRPSSAPRLVDRRAIQGVQCDVVAFAVTADELLGPSVIYGLGDLDHPQDIVFDQFDVEVAVSVSDKRIHQIVTKGTGRSKQQPNDSYELTFADTIWDVNSPNIAIETPK